MSTWSNWRHRRFGRGPRPIKPLKGPPYNNIKSWCYEKSKRMKENPLTGKTRKVKEKDLKLPQLRKTLNNIIDRINKCIHWITMIPIIKKRIMDLEQKHARDTKLMKAMILANTAADVSHRLTPTPATHSPWSSMYGSYRSAARRYYSKGGKFTQPVLSNKRIRKLASGGPITNKGQIIKIGDTIKDMNST